MNVPDLLYILVSVILAYRWVGSAENKWFLAILLGWLFGTPILGNQRYIISLGVLGVDLQPDRILFLLLLVTLCFFIVQTWFAGKSLWDYRLQRLKPFELWLVIYISFAGLAMVINLDQLGAKTVIVTFIKCGCFLLAYFFGRECISRHDFEIFVKAIAVFAVLSSLIGLYQFLVDESFFRLGVMRPAFGRYTRANGLFFSEYDQGVFLTIALIISWLMLPNPKGRLFVMSTIPLGVFCTMHRASWVICLATFGMIAIHDLRQNRRWIVTEAFLVLTVFFLIINFSIPSAAKGFLNELVQLRIEDNTWDVRMHYNRFALTLIQKYPLGIGDYVSDIYFIEAYKQSMSFMEGRPLIIHNGFLSAGVLYGVPGALTFVFFTFSSLLYSLRHLSSRAGYSVSMIMIAFILINISQDLSFLGNQIGILLGICIAVTSRMFELSQIRQTYPLNARNVSRKAVLR